MHLIYTICFIRHRDRVLMLRRKFAPLAGLLNGVGGKIEPGESPRESIVRETLEETGLHLADLTYGGIVTWTGHTTASRGMYAYVADLPPGVDPASLPRDMAEGSLLWVDLADLMALRVPAVSNIPVFLAPMLAGLPPQEYHLFYLGEELVGHEVRPLPEAARNQ